MPIRRMTYPARNWIGPEQRFFKYFFLGRNGNSLRSHFGSSLLAMIKCSICSYQCDNWYVSNWAPFATCIFFEHYEAWVAFWLWSSVVSVLISVTSGIYCFRALWGLGGLLAMKAFGTKRAQRSLIGRCCHSLSGTCPSPAGTIFAAFAPRCCLALD